MRIRSLSQLEDFRNNSPVAVNLIVEEEDAHSSLM